MWQKKFNKYYYRKNVIFLLTKTGHFLPKIIDFSRFYFKMPLSFWRISFSHPAPFKGPWAHFFICIFLTSGVEFPITSVMG